MSASKLDLVPVPAESITLRDARTKTRRDVVLDGFAISRYPLTWSQFVAVTGGQEPDRELANTPVHSISWLEAVEWCNTASRMSGLRLAYAIDGTDVMWDVSADGYRLPTEAEWEFACRAGTTGPLYGALKDIAWTDSDGVEGAQVVGLKQANGFGLFDMLGNVWEWCWDYSDPARYADYRVMRGGGWADKPWSTRASVRRGSMPGARLDDVGFRVARGVVGEESSEEGQGWSRRADRERAAVAGPIPFGWTPLR